MRKLLTALLAAALLVTAAPSVSAEGDGNGCDYNVAITGCAEEVYFVDHLPENIEVHTAVVKGNVAACAQVSTDVVWCVVSDVPAQLDVAPTSSNPCILGFQLVFDARLGAICADTRPLLPQQQPISFTG